MVHRVCSAGAALLLATVGIVVLAIAPVLAQSSAGGGSIQGTVKDMDGAIIPGAKVVIRHIATGRVTNTVSNGEGFFFTPPLNIGPYKVRVTAAGMKAWEGELVVEAGRLVEISPALSPGEVTETVVISGNITPLTTTTEPTDHSTLDSQRIKDLPINGRNINTLIEDVTPGVEGINDVNGGVRISGLMAYSTEYVQDGATSNNREFGGSGGIQGLESMGEVRIETSTSSARYTTPTNIIVSTKSGTNAIHGSLYETHRNNSFGVARARQDVNLSGLEYKAPHLIRNEFGGSIGGPLFLPRFGEGGKMWYDGRNRSFFFFSREGIRFRQAVTREFTVPTAAMRRGDFSQLIDVEGRKITLYDPLTTRPGTRPNGQPLTVRDPFPDNQIPISRMSPLAKRMFELTPLPTDITNPVTAYNLKMPVPTNAFPNQNGDTTTVRLDHRFSERDNTFIKVNGGKTYSHFLGTAGNIGAPTPNNEANVTYLPMRNIAGAMSWTHVFSTQFFVETLFNRTWQISQTMTGPVDDQRDWSQELGLPNDFGEIGWPNMTNLGLANIGNNLHYSYIEGDNRRALHSIITNFEQNYTLIRGTHNIQFGGRFRNERNHLLPDQGGISGTSYYNSLATALENPASSAANPGALPQTGYDTANFFLGYAGRYDVGFKRGYLQVYEKKFGFYVQDTYKMSPRLTLTPGLRWDINPIFHERNGLINTFDVETRSLVLPESMEYYYKKGVTTPEIVQRFRDIGMEFKTAEELGMPKNLFKSNLYDFSPRAGFAYRLWDNNKQLVIRGGYGIYTSAIPMRTLLAQFSSLPPFRTTFTYNPNNSNQSPDRISNYLLRGPQTFISGLNTVNAVDVVNLRGLQRGQAVRGMGENQPSLRIHEWNLTVEKQISQNTVIRLRYTGKHGVNADQLIEINPQGSDYFWYVTMRRPIPQGELGGVARRIYDQNAYTEVRILEKTGYINSSTWSLEMERRFTKGLGFQAFYTMTNALRMAGNSFRDDVAVQPSIYFPELGLPNDINKLNRMLFYDRDTGIPKHRVRWNWRYELPFGTGKKLGTTAGGFLNGVIGGWVLTGTGTVLNTWYALPTGNWGEMGEFEVYGKKYPITDCRATPPDATNQAQERCTPGYLWFNGYISERVINSRNAAGLRNGVFGLPENYRPAQKPINPWPKGGLPTDPRRNDYDTNVVYIPITNTNGTITNQRVNYDLGYHPWRNQYKMGPFNMVVDTSLQKYFRITEKVRLRANIDFFNVFNIQGLNTPNGEGIVSLSNSYNPNSQVGFRPRQLQGSLRLEW
jgi:Carboxypeptidase regulatory-like domain/TonB dependent receptor